MGFGLVTILLSTSSAIIRRKKGERIEEISESVNKYRNTLVQFHGKIIKSRLGIPDANSDEIANALNMHLSFTGFLIILILASAGGEAHDLAWFIRPFQSYGAFIFASVATGVMWERFANEYDLNIDIEVDPLRGAFSTAYGLLLASLSSLVYVIFIIYGVPRVHLPEYVGIFGHLLFLVALYLMAGIESVTSVVVASIQIALVLIILIGLGLSGFGPITTLVVFVLISVPMILRTDRVWNYFFE